MVAAGIVLFLIGVWFVIRTILGGLGATVTRNSEYALLGGPSGVSTETGSAASSTTAGIPAGSAASPTVGGTPAPLPSSAGAAVLRSLEGELSRFLKRALTPKEKRELRRLQSKGEL